jgi:hypothetical protein
VERSVRRDADVWRDGRLARSIEPREILKVACRRLFATPPLAALPRPAQRSPSVRGDRRIRRQPDAPDRPIGVARELDPFPSDERVAEGIAPNATRGLSGR